MDATKTTKTAKTATTPARAQASSPSLRRSRRREGLLACLFLLPALAALTTFRILPAGWLIITSVRGQSGSLVGLANFQFLFGQPSFVQTVATTLLFVLITVPFQIALAFALALLFTQRLPGVAIFRVAVFIPVAVPGAVAAILWGMAYRPDGLVNALLGIVGIPPQPFLNSPNQALGSVVILISWIGVGFWMVFLIGGLKDISVHLYEAASIDGAGPWSRFLRITVPLMHRSLAFVLVADTVAAFLLFAPVAILTRGGPINSTQLIMYDVYQQAFIFGDIHLAAAEALVLMAVMMVVVAAQFRFLSRD